MTDNTLPSEFRALLEQHQGLEALLAFVVVGSAAELRRDSPESAEGMLAWAASVREAGAAGWAGCISGDD
ncbi:MAG: hypothetical protein ABR885_14525 [Mycobacterium sp.]|jgi:hypothetical protein